MISGVGIIPNWQKENVNEVVKEISSFFIEHNVNVFTTSHRSPWEKVPPPLTEIKEWEGLVDIIIVVGGDGTILRVAREVSGKNFSLLGVNVGHKGFLAGIDVKDLARYLSLVINMDFLISERMMLRVSVFRKQKEIASNIALNDIVISRGPFSRIIKLDAYINEDFLETYPGDGLIVSTPTGSTGYSLSAGGPIVHPSMELFIITPICPHLLYSRSVIVSGNDTININAGVRDAEFFITIDGQIGFPLRDDDQIRITKSSSKTKLVTFKDNNFFTILERKLKNS